MTRFSFLHAADIHLDSGFVGVSSRSPEAAIAALHATRRAFTRLIDTAIEEGVNFVLIAGDLYDSAPKDVEIGHYVRREAGRLERAGIGLFIIKGNHDSESEIADALPMPPNVHVFSSRKTESISVPGLEVVIHGRSFPQRHVPEDLSAEYPPPLEGVFNIGLLHTSAGGYPNHATYAPCAPDVLGRKGYDYWALGHVHEAAVLIEDPPVCFSGCLQGRSVRETGAKGAWLAEVADDRPTLRFIAFDVARWHRLTCDLSGAEDEGEVASRLRAGLADAVSNAEGRAVFVRLELGGDTGMDPWLRKMGNAALFDWVEAIAAAQEDVFIEKLHLRTAPPVTNDPVTIAPLIDALRLACEDPALHAEIEAMEKAIGTRLPGKAAIDAMPGGIASVIADARRLLLSRADSGGEA